MPVVGERGACSHLVLLASFHARVGTDCDGSTYLNVGFLDI